MTRTNKKIRLFAAMVAIAMVVCMIPVTGLAANTVTVTSATVDATGKITVTGTISDGTAGVAKEVTILASKQATEITSAEALLTMTDATIAYIDQVTANADGSFEFKFIPKKGLGGKYVTIFVGGTDVETFNADNIKNITMPVKAAGAIEAIEEKTSFILDVDAIEFNVNSTDAADGWTDIIADNVAVYADGVAVETANVSYAEGKLTVTGLALEDVLEKEFTLKVSGEAEDFDDASIDFTVVSPTKVVADALAANISVAYLTDGTEDTAYGKALIALPTVAEDYDTAIAWAFVEAADSDVETTTGITAATGDYDYELARPAEGGEVKAQTYYLKATVTLGTLKVATKVYAISVKALGNAGPSFTTTTIDAEDAFGVDGALQIALKTEDVNSADEKIMVGTTELYYAPQRGAFVGIVEGYADMDAILEAVEVVAIGSEYLYYGKVADTTSDAVLDVFDIGQMIIMFKAGNATTATVQQKLAADVFGEGAVDIFAVGNAITAMKGGNINTLFTVIGK